MGNCQNKSHDNQRLIEKKDFQINAIKWNLSPLQISHAYKQARKDQFKISCYKMSVDDEMKCFLYAKNVLDEDFIIRDYILKKLFQKIKEEEQKKYERLYRIVSIGEQSREDFSGFDRFVVKNPKWNKLHSWVLFRDHPLLACKNAYVERTQLSSLCFMHAPVVFQHYLVAMNSHEKIGMVDISDYLRKHVDSESLKNHIFSNSGGHSVEFLRNLLHLPNHEMFEKPDVKSNEIPEMMKKYGPCLVSSMEIWSCFYDYSKQIHLGNPLGMMTGHHSVIICGYRFEGNEIRYLLQNWWISKVFIEVNADYLRACGAILTFCKSVQKSIPSTFETNFSRHVEMTIDACECLPMETAKKF